MKPRRLRRSRFLIFSLEDQRTFDVLKFLQGELALGQEQVTVIASNPLSGGQMAVDGDQLSILRNVPAGRWMPESDLMGFMASRSIGTSLLEELIEHGFIFTFEEDQHDTDVDERFLFEERCSTLGWPKDALVYHQQNMRREAQIAASAQPFEYEENLKHLREIERERIQKNGPPPPTFFQIDTKKSYPIPREEDDAAFFEILTSRRTSRLLNAEAGELDASRFSKLMHYVFSSWGEFKAGDHLTLQLRTSPSGGGLHPIEAFPLILSVEGVAPGIYHYNSGARRLDQIRFIPEDRGRELIVELGQEQLYMGGAQFVVFLVARWERNFWKYKSRTNTYSVVLMDAGHLSQTFYLCATALGLGAFFSAALRHGKIYSLLGLSSSDFGIIGVCGAGTPRE